jgi:hypothetical protein
LIEVFGADPALQPTPLDVTKLNEGIVALLKPLFDDERTIESFKLGFDPAETNFAKDSARLIAETRLKKSAWSSKPSQIDLGVTARFQRGDKGAPQARLEGQINVTTEVIPLANHAVARFLQRSGSRPARTSQPSANDVFMAQVRERLMQVNKISSMDELVDLIVDLAALRLKTMNERIVDLANQVRAEDDAAARERLETELAEARLERDHMFDVRPRVERDGAGKAVAMHFTLSRDEVDDTAQLDRLAVSITAERITVDVAGMQRQGMEAYALLKPLVTNTLTRIQDRDPETLRLGQGILGGLLRDGRDDVLEKAE